MAPPRLGPPAAPKKKLAYLEAREWEQMEQKILEAEEALEAARAAMQAPEIVSDPVALQQRYSEMQAAEAEVEKLCARWAELEGKLDPRALTGETGLPGLSSDFLHLPERGMGGRLEAGVGLEPRS